MFFGLLLAELLLRIFSLAPTGGLATVTQRDFDRIPGLFAPNQELIEREVPEAPYHISIDSLGYRRTSTFERLKPPGQIRVLMLGDSFTFGYLVSDDQTLPAQLERLLQASCGDNVLTINAGVGGTSLETTAPMASRALPLGIDIAVLTFSENDVTDLATPLWDQLAANRAVKSRFPMSMVYPVVRQMALWNLMLKARAKWRARSGTVTARATSATVRAERAPPANDSMVTALRSNYRERLARLSQSLSAAKVPLIVAIYPSHLSLYQNRDEQIRWIEQTAGELGLPTVNLEPALKRDGRPQEQLYFLPIDGHPSAAGYAVVAPVIQAELLKLPGLARRCSTPGASATK